MCTNVCGFSVGHLNVYITSVQCQSFGAGKETADEHWGQKKHFLRANDQWRLPGCIWKTVEVCYCYNDTLPLVSCSEYMGMKWIYTCCKCKVNVLKTSFLWRMGLKDKQEREIVHVLMDCCLQEKTFNAFYAVLGEKFCSHDRRFQVLKLGEKKKKHGSVANKY